MLDLPQLVQAVDGFLDLDDAVACVGCWRWTVKRWKGSLASIEKSPGRGAWIMRWSKHSGVVQTGGQRSGSAVIATV